MVYLFLANGFEITEAMAPLDVMRRAGMDVKTVGVTGEYVESSNVFTVKPHPPLAKLSYDHLHDTTL